MKYVGLPTGKGAENYHNIKLKSRADPAIRALDCLVAATWLIDLFTPLVYITSFYENPFLEG